MTTLLYIHGFLSSPLSHKAQQVNTWLAQYRPDITYICPQLPPYPNVVAERLESVISSAKGPIYIMGSSMGGFWATWLAERYCLKAVIINPAVNVDELMPAYLGKHLKNYHHDESYWLTREHLQALHAYRIEHIKQPANYWLFVQTGDETLDYRLAVEKYRGSQQTIELGGDHSFQHFERHIESALQFLER